MAAMASTVRVELRLDDDVIAALRERYPRNIEAGIRAVLAEATKRPIDFLDLP